jgi:drug/metabolite transporter (DMT)-like permease
VLLATLALVLASAFLHALWNALLKKASNLEAASLGILAVSLLATAALTPFVPGPAFPDGPALAWGLGAGVFEGLYFLTLARALASSSLGWSYTWMRGGSLLLVWPLSILLLGESLHLLGALSVLAVCGGLGLMGLAPGRGGSRESLAWAGAVGAATCGYTLCYKVGLAHGARPVPLYAVSMCVSLPVQVLARALRRGFLRSDFLTPQWGLVLLAGLVCTASFLLYLVALGLGGAGVMATLRNLSVVFAVLFSRILGERPTPRQWAGACLVAAGAVGLAF